MDRPPEVLYGRYLQADGYWEYFDTLADLLEQSEPREAYAIYKLVEMSAIPAPPPKKGAPK